MEIRKAQKSDLSRVAEIFVFNNRINYFPIFGDESYSFGEMQVIPLAEGYFSQKEILENLYVFDSGIIKGFVLMQETEIEKLYVDPFFQGGGVGGRLIEYAIRELGADRLWVLEKNTRATAFYQRHGFRPTGEKKLEEDTTEYLLRMKRQPHSAV